MMKAGAALPTTKSVAIESTEQSLIHLDGRAYLITKLEDSKSIEQSAIPMDGVGYLTMTSDSKSCLHSLSHINLQQTSSLNSEHHMKLIGYLIIFETADGLRIPSAVVHHTREGANIAKGRADQRGKPVDIVEIEWDDSIASKPWN
ncbi:hypothetical protein AB8A05_08130 [Tardiphaga sp. 538_B7_N1_4]|uniref:hypothetical protein n=1 Tax=Tardiphaga sp. 538_B7_N1_4 TaxID=3240778 RepID=UPI003F1EDA50